MLFFFLKKALYGEAPNGNWNDQKPYLPPSEILLFHVNRFDFTLK